MRYLVDRVKHFFTPAEKASEETPFSEKVMNFPWKWGRPEKLGEGGQGVVLHWGLGWVIKVMPCA